MALPSKTDLNCWFVELKLVYFCMVTELSSPVTRLKLSAENIIVVSEENVILYSFV